MPAILQVGHVVAGRWHIEGYLGVGGMGMVYRVRHHKTGRNGALKINSGKDSGRGQRHRLFEREYQVLGELDHRHIVHVLDADELPGGQPFYVMQYVPGQSLDEVIGSEGPLGLERARLLLSGVASALDAAASRGIVHRDVKPSNILVAHDDHPYLCDFGIAHVVTGTALTTGLGLGTWEYASPEHIDRAKLCAASDQYSLACVLYECLTGRVPFPRDSAEAAIAAHLADDPEPPSAFNRAVSDIVDAAVLRALAKDPVDRFATSSDFIASLTASGSAAVAQRTPSPPDAPASDVAVDVESIMAEVMRELAAARAASAPDQEEPAAMPRPGEQWSYQRPPFVFSLLPSAMDIAARDGAPVAGKLSKVLGRERAAGVARRLLVHRPSGGRFGVDADGDAVSYSAAGPGHAVIYLGRVAPDEWWPGLVTEPADAADPATWDPAQIPVLPPRPPVASLAGYTGSVPAMVKRGWKQAIRRPIAQRFLSAGWVYEGFCRAPCPECGRALAVFRLSVRRNYRYWGLYCSNCCRLYAPSDVTEYGWGRRFPYDE